MLHAAEDVVRVQDFIRRGHAQQGHVRFLRRGDHRVAILLGHGRIDAVQVDLLDGGRQRQDLVLVFQQDQRAALRVQASLDEVRLAHRGGRIGRIDERMLEQALLEFLDQDAPRRRVDALLRQLATLHGLRQVRRFRHAAKLVHPRRHGLHVALGLGGVFHAPRRAKAHEGRRDARRRAVAAVGVAVGGDAPVGQDHAFEAVFAAQQIRQHGLAEAGRHLFQGDAVDRDIAVRQSIGRHDGSRLGREGAFERFHVVGEVVARVGHVAAIVIVAVVTLFRGAVADPVLDDGHHAAVMQARVPVLEALDIVLHHALGQVRVFAKGAVDARPARLGGQIGLRRQGLRDADGQVFLARDVAEAAHQRIVADGGQAQGFRPLRKTLGAGAGAHRVLEMVARVRADGHRDAVARRFAQRLHLVVLGRHVGRVARHARNEGVDVLLDDQVLQGRQIVRAALADAGGVGHGGRRAVHHQARFFIEAHVR
ncbi:hypothetical protein D3C87_1261940 [compost metagenome]